MDNFSWCEELKKLDSDCGCQTAFGSLFGLLPKPQPEPFLNKALRVVTAVLSQRQSSRLNYGTKPKKQGHCRHIDLKDCNLLKGGEGCRRNTRLTAHCPFRLYFALRQDGTISTKLRNDAYLALLYNLRGMAQGSIGYG